MPTHTTGTTGTATGTNPGKQKLTANEVKTGLETAVFVPLPGIPDQIAK